MFDEMRIEKLFGNFNYDIKLKEKGVTILTGPNGFGKSTILKIFDSLFNGDIMFFYNLDFEKISFFNFNSKTLTIKKSDNILFVNDIKIDVNTMFADTSKMLNRWPYLTQIDDDHWFDRSNGRMIDSERFFLDYNDEATFKSYKFDYDNDLYKNKNVQKAIKMMKELSGEIRYIKEQRLISEKQNSRNEKQVINVIEDLPNNFKRIMSSVSNQYSAIANKLDSSYPSRLFATKKGISEEEFAIKTSSMNERFEKLAKFDISEIKPSETLDFLAEHAKALKVYFEDFENKYQVFQEFINQLEMFTEIVNSRLKFKMIKISRENGIEVYKIGDEEKNLKLSQLSSGEKQEIVLFYDLIFKIDHNVHLLIDEPEISLHIEWQLKFMDDLLRIAKHKNLKVTVATHSPQIINNHWDIQIDLGEMYGS